MLLKNLLIIFSLIINLPVALASSSSVDVLVLAPHPDDEALCCTGTIKKYLESGKKVKIIYFTNGDAYVTAVNSYFKTKAGDFKKFGDVRQSESQQAMEKLGLRREDLIFLSYPDGGLSKIWATKKSFYSKYLGISKSPYKQTYKRAKNEYNRENLEQDLTEIFTKYSPKKIYLPYFTDDHPDHAVVPVIVHSILTKFKNNKKLVSPDFFYYQIHQPTNSSLTIQPNFNEDISEYLKLKEGVLKTYQTQIGMNDERQLFNSFLIRKESFWKMAVSKKNFLEELEGEWAHIGEVFLKNGFNVNFGMIADVADNLNNLRNPLVANRRIISQDPDEVALINKSMILGMNKGGVTPVIKHFPGLGRGLNDTHVWHVNISASKEDLLRIDMKPFRELIDSKLPFWIMVGHSIYPNLDNEPASLSKKIINGTLREEMGFNGLVVVDELLAMQAIEQYAIKMKFKSPYLPKVVLKAFMAGADIALIYPHPQDVFNILDQILIEVEEGIKSGVYSEKELNQSLERIFKEKERIFKKPLLQFIKGMTLKEKIAQKLMVDALADIHKLTAYQLGGLHFRSKNKIDLAQSLSKVPLFISGQHEGGIVNQHDLNLITRSPYAVGKQWRQVKEKNHHLSSDFTEGEITPNDDEEYAYQNFFKLEKNQQDRLVNNLIESIDFLIKKWTELLVTGVVTPNPSNLTPIVFKDNGILELRTANDLPVTWIKNLKNQSEAFAIYGLLKYVFKEWEEKLHLNDFPGKNNVHETIGKLQSLKNWISVQFSIDKSKKLLVLATHPDDEDGAALAYFKQHLGYKTHLLLCTNGEGGDNQLDERFGEELKTLRSEELTNAAALLDVDQVNSLNAPDFGYTGSEKEVWRHWNREKLLEKLVYYIRLIRPEVIISKNRMTDSHGHHKAFIALAKEAFIKAQDHKEFKSQLELGLLPFSPKAFLVRNENKTGKIKIDSSLKIGEKSISQLEIESLKKHQSQGDWSWYQKTVESNKNIEYEIIASAGNFETFSKSEEKNVESSDLKLGFIPAVRYQENSKIGVVEGINGIISISLRKLGIRFESLNQKSDLNNYTVILIGAGVYNHQNQKWIQNDKLLTFVKKGGRAIVFDQFGAGKLSFPFAPFGLKAEFLPIEWNDSITKEEGKMGGGILNYPNLITADDFKREKGELGMFFATEYNPNYQELLQVKKNGKLVKSGILYLPLDKGEYIYTSFNWNKRLKEEDLVAFKILANFISVSKMENLVKSR